MAAYKPIRIGDSVPLQQINPTTETIDGLIQVSTTGVVLGRITAGAGGHEEIPFANLPGGGASYTEITYADMATAIAGSTLTPGGWYLISDASGTDLGFLTYAVKENEISLAGVGGYLNADFQAVGDYSGVEAITGQAAGTQQWIWQAANEGSYVQGDVVIWNLLHWQLTDSGLVDGTDPATNVAAYTQLLKTDVNQGYIIAWDASEFDFLNNIIKYREDKNGNVIRTNSMSGIPFGNDAFSGNFIFGNSFVSVANYLGGIGSNFIISGAIFNIQGGEGSYINNCTLYSSSIISELILGANTAIENNILENGAQLTGITAGANCSISNNKISSGSTLGTGTTLSDNSYITANNILGGGSILNITLDVNAGVTGNTLDGGNIDGATLGEFSSISGNYLFRGDMLTVTIGNTSVIASNSIDSSGQLTGITAGANCSISRNKIGQGATLGGSTTMGDGVFIDNNSLESSASITDLVIDNNIELSRNSLGINSIITGIDLHGSIINNVLQRGSSIGKIFHIERSIININSAVESNFFISDCGLFDFVLGQNSNFAGNSIGASTGFLNFVGYSVNLPDNAPLTNCEIYLSGIFISNAVSSIIEKSARIGFSSFEQTLDITGLTTLDCLAENNYVGIFNLTSSNATEAIDIIDNPPTSFPFTLRPAAGLVLTVTGTAYAGIAAGQIALKATDYTLDGDKGEFIILEIDPLGTGALIEKQVINGLI